MPDRRAARLRLLQPVGQCVGRPRRGGCAPAQMVRLICHAVGATTMAAAHDSVASANSSSASAQPPATPDWIASWPGIEQTETSRRIQRPRRSGGLIRLRPATTAGGSGVRAGQTETFAHATEPRAPIRWSRQSHGMQQKPSARLELARRGRPERWPIGTDCRRVGCARSNGIGARHLCRYSKRATLDWTPLFTRNN